MRTADTTALQRFDGGGDDQPLSDQDGVRLANREPLQPINRQLLDASAKLSDYCLCRASGSADNFKLQTLVPGPLYDHKIAVSLDLKTMLVCLNPLGLGCFAPEIHAKSWSG